MSNDHCHRVITQLQLINIIIIIMSSSLYSCYIYTIFGSSRQTFERASNLKLHDTPPSRSTVQRGKTDMGKRMAAFNIFAQLTPLFIQTFTLTSGSDQLMAGVLRVEI